MGYCRISFFFLFVKINNAIKVKFTKNKYYDRKSKEKIKEYEQSRYLSGNGKVKAKDCSKNMKGILQEQARNCYRNLSKEEKKKKGNTGEMDLLVMYSIKNG